MKRHHLNDAEYLPTKAIMAYVKYVNGCNCADCPDCKTLRNLEVTTEYSTTAKELHFLQRGECPVCKHKFYRRWNMPKATIKRQYAGEKPF